MRKLLIEEMNRISAEEFKTAEKFPFIAVLDNVRSMLNVGSVFRTADAMRFEKIVLCGITGRPPHREIRKTAIGAEDSVDWIYEENTAEILHKLKDEGYEIVAVEQIENSQSLQNFRPENGKKYALVFGNEVYGMDKEALEECDRAIEIPQFGTKHSLNISVSAGMVFWHCLQAGGYLETGPRQKSDTKN